MTTPEGTPIPRGGLTGGIGSGKSTVAGLLAEHGAVVIDADRIAREVVAPGEPALEEIAAAFGAGMLTDDGSLDRGRMAELVFSDPAARRRLEEITHPRIHVQINATIDAILTSSDDEPSMIVIDHPLLVETGLAGSFDAVVVVVADEDLRIHRMVEQRGMEPSDARARIDAQADDGTRLAAATHVVHNNGTRHDLRDRVTMLHAELADLLAPNS